MLTYLMSQREITILVGVVVVVRNDRCLVSRKENCSHKITAMKLHTVK